MARNPKAYIRLKGRNGNFDISLYLGNGRPRITGGGAEYEAGRRPRADAVTLFTGNALLTVDVPVLFDGWGPPGERHNIGPRVDQVYGLCFGRDRRPPPVFTATYPGPGSGGLFQMALPEELEEPRPIVGEGGTLFRQALVLKLVEFNDPQGLDWRRKKTFARNDGIVAPKTSIKLKRPTSLLEVAAGYYGNVDEAPRLGRINGVADLRKKLPTGRRVKLGTQIQD